MPCQPRPADPHPVIDHYYHWAAEALLGLWRVHTSQDLSINPLGVSKLPAPARIWFMHQDSNQWSVRAPSRKA